MSIKKSLRSLIFEEGKDQKKEEPRFNSKFPETNSGGATSFPANGNSQTTFMESSTATAPPVPTVNIPLECAPHMDSIMQLYENGFASLNQPGVEFYEFFEAIVEAGINDSAAYKMALKMLSKMEKTMTKDSLVLQSQFYIDELTKVHAKYNAEGQKKKSDLTADKNAEGQKLGNDIRLLKEQMESLRNQLSAKEMQLSQIDNRYLPKISECDCKLMANDEAKNRIMGTITSVVNGIKANL